VDESHVHRLGDGAAIAVGVLRAPAAFGSVEVVGEAEDGATAPTLLKAHLADVALLDYRAGMDGAQVAAAVRRDKLPTRVSLVSTP
jgi:two-component system, NarL family, nitrate/nitrite response regulator NarL